MGKEGNKTLLIVAAVVAIVIAGYFLVRTMTGGAANPGQVPESYGAPPGEVPPGAFPGQ